MSRINYNDLYTMYETMSRSLYGCHWNVPQSTKKNITDWKKEIEN